ncbi:hypothetical protein ADL07_28390 [Streptomyces sp. NRRL F-4707]|nr:hypothetical protein ADK87_23200 [Streptomyces sp. NRRL F-4711]KOX28407.1 hypothetical protein ADL07_28390 [Streptomyces sp. NRRL F-4707]
MISKPLSKAKAARCFFYVQLRESFEPPALAVISNQVASGWCTWPRRCRQRRMDSTANSAVSWSVPTLTQPVLVAMS